MYQRGRATGSGHNRDGYATRLAECDYGSAYPALLIENPRGPERGIARVIRGGSWRSSLTACRAAAREQNRETFSSDDLGFRVLCE